MRLLVVVSHYYRTVEKSAFTSGLDPFSKISSLNEEIIALHRHFGGRRHGATPIGVSLPDDVIGDAVVDVVILTDGTNQVLDWIGIDPSIYETKKCDCNPLYLGFEAQQVFRERLGQYDFYCFMEDDLVVHDSLFFEKLKWFQKQFGPRALLLPLRYEMTHSGTPAKVSIEFDLNGKIQQRFRRPGQAEILRGEWLGSEQMFCLPINPHSGCYFLTEEQVRHWIKQPSFDDRDGSWTGPLESAATLTVGKIFDIYKPSTPNPWFLEIQHYGNRYANFFAPPGVVYDEHPLLSLAREVPISGGEGEASSNIWALIQSSADRNYYRDIESRTTRELRFLRSSPRRLFKALLVAIWNRATRTLRRALNLEPK